MTAAPTRWVLTLNVLDIYGRRDCGLQIRGIVEGDYLP